MPTEWFVIRNNTAAGPYTAATLKALAAEGKIGPSDLIRKGRDGKPVLASAIKGLSHKDSHAAADSNDRSLSRPNSGLSIDWYYGKDGERFGPVTWDRLQSLARARQLDRSDLVWRDGFSDWAPAATIDGLFASTHEKLAAAIKARPPIPFKAPVARQNGGPKQQADPSESLFISADTLGLSRILPSAVLSKLSNAGFAIGLTILIVLVLVLVSNGSFSTAIAFALAFVIYFDAAANKIGLIPPRKWFTVNISAGMWATLALLLWPFILPAYLINRPRLLQKAIENPQEPSARRLKLGILGALAALFLLASFGPPNSRPGQRQFAERQVMPAPQAHADRQVADISWSEIEQTYGLHSKTTDIQKEHLWNDKYKGKRIRWRGAVRNLRKGLLYGGTLDIRMDRNTLTHDVEVNLDQSVEVDKASQYSKEALVTFEGTLANYGVSFLDIIVVDDGKIVDTDKHAQP